MVYSFIKKILFLLEPETSHSVALNSLRFLGAARLTRKPISAPCDVMGLSFSNKIGLAAGLDKNGEYIDALAALGFGFIEVGTVTPKPQAGNPKPRLFRLEKQEAIINRMGFNNKGVNYLVERLQQTKYQGILGINIGKNKDTPIESALNDYVYCMRRVLPFASYITINISSPNTENLRQLQEENLLRQLLRALKQVQLAYAEKHKKYVPLVVKIAPDITPEQISTMATIFLQEKIDGVIATNTTLSREGLQQDPLAKEAGGLSGKPLLARSTAIVAMFHQQLGAHIPIIACGGIMSADDARAKMQAGASLVQVYTGLIYRGPGLVKKLGDVIMPVMPARF